MLNRSNAAIEGAKALEQPIIVTEQYPKGLGLAGAHLVTVEVALSDMLGCAGTPEFKKVSAAVR